MVILGQTVTQQLIKDTHLTPALQYVKVGVNFVNHVYIFLIFCDIDNMHYVLSFGFYLR